MFQFFDEKDLIQHIPRKVFLKKLVIFLLIRSY